jgi:hypothetical protein
MTFIYVVAIGKQRIVVETSVQESWIQIQNYKRNQCRRYDHKVAGIG